MLLFKNTCCKGFSAVLLLLLLPFAVLAQARKITGKVVSPDNRAMQGVSIQIKGKPGGTTSDAQGNFSVTAESNDTLVASFVGYENAELAVGNTNNIQLTLQTTNNALQGVVVVGYGTQKRKDVTGAVASIDTKALSSTPIPNAGEAMEGRAAGVQVISAGAPGSNVTFRIRGTGTINNADPLIVVDGVPSDAPLNNLNSNDIASIDVLKDASAAAIYGSRGANGVVLITTKKGVNGKGTSCL